MAWRDPTPFECNLLEDVRDRWPEILPLARHLCLAPRVEPLLMRNVRHRFVPQAPTEIESLLWFSPLVAARSTREIVFHLGVARLLADELLGEPDATTRLESLWQYTCRHTRHWNVEDRLERDLRYHALRAEGADLREKLQTILRRLRQETDAEQRLKLSRLVKRALPVIAPTFADMQEARWLAQYAAQALGDAGAWVNPGPPTAPPRWLAEKLPASQAASELSVEIRHDSQHGQVLHFLTPQADLPTLRFAHPLPVRLHIAPEGEIGAWYPVAIGVRIPIQPASPRLTLTTLEGARWDLRTQVLPRDEPDSPVQHLLWLAHVEADREQAEALARWLAEQGLTARLLPETQAAAAVEAAPDARILRLWTQAAKRQWASNPVQPPILGGVLLRIEEVDLPSAGTPGGLLDWRDWQRFGDSPDARRLLESLTRWLEHGEVPPAPGEAADANPDDEEIARLLAEIDNPETPPPRRLEIGDRLAELGDHRPGVGVREIEVALDKGEASFSAQSNGFMPDRQERDGFVKAGHGLSELESLDAQDAVIKVIGVGGCGGNAVDHMIGKGMLRVEFIVINTDAQAFKRCRAPVQLQIGSLVTKGLGAGGRPEMGREAALEDRERIAELINGADLLFIIAGMGGGTGTGAAPVVAEVAKDMGILTVAVVTKPFVFEQKKRMRTAEQGLKALSEHIDCMIVLPNEKLIQVRGDKAKLTDAFIAANDVLHSAVSSIADLIITPGMINVDFADVRMVLSETGMAMMGSAEAEGENRASQAAQSVLNNPLLENINLRGAHGVLVNISASDSLTLDEYYEVMNTIQGFAAEDATVIVGTSLDENMDESLRVTMVATGFGNPRRATVKKPDLSIVELEQKQATGTEDLRPFTTKASASSDSTSENLDIPAFLRKQTD